jgi:hypothetical protein
MDEDVAEDAEEATPLDDWPQYLQSPNIAQSCTQKFTVVMYV